jgi:hypothetical protein
MIGVAGTAPGLLFSGTMMANTARFRALPIVAVALAMGSAAAGCSDKMCTAQPLPAPWKPYEALIPADTVICGSNRNSSDSYPPTQLFVFYKKQQAHEAFKETTTKFEAAGWKLSNLSTTGTGKSMLLDADAAKGGVKIHIGVNRNDFGVQGSFNLTPASR